MSQTITITASAETQDYLQRLKGQPQRIARAICAGMDAANQLAVANIQEKHLTGVGPYPVEEHRLGVRTNRLRGSVRASATRQVSERQYESAIGSNVIYAAIHEFGGVIHRKAAVGKVRLKTDAGGRLIRQANHPHLAVFAKTGAKRAKEVATKTDAYDIHMPARAPFATGIRESLPVYNEEIARRLAAAMKGN